MVGHFFVRTGGSRRLAAFLTRFMGTWRRGLQSSNGPCPTLGARVSGHVAHQAGSVPLPRLAQPTQSQGRGEGWRPGLPPEQEESSRADAVILLMRTTASIFTSTRPGPEHL